MPPAFVKLLSATPSAEGTQLVFLGADNQQYSFLVETSVVGDVIAALQEELLPKRGAGGYLTLTVAQHQPVATPTAKGLVFRTREAGAIAFALPDEVIPKLRADLARLEALKPPGTKQ